MSLARKQAVILALAWLAIAILSTIIVTHAGVDRIAGPAGHRTRSLLASVILPGYLISFAVMWRTRRGRRAGDIDERDQAVEHKATEITAIITLLAVYLAGMGLFDAHADTGVVPAGWLYVLAYGTIVLVSLAHPLAALILDFSGRVDA